MAGIFAMSTALRKKMGELYEMSEMNNNSNKADIKI